MLFDEVTRSFYYCQLKAHVLEGRLRCEPEEAVPLAAYSLQLECGDFDPDRHTVEFLSNCRLFPNAILQCMRDGGISLYESLIQAYRNLQGVQPNVAEMVYITEAQNLEGIAQEGFPAKDSTTNEDVTLGVCLRGIFSVKQNAIEQFCWPDIANLIHDRRLLIIEMTSGNIKRNYLLHDTDFARMAWKICVDQHQYFMRGTTIQTVIPKRESEDSTELTPCQKESYFPDAKSVLPPLPPHWTNPVGDIASRPLPPVQENIYSNGSEIIVNNNSSNSYADYVNESSIRQIRAASQPCVPSISTTLPSSSPSLANTSKSNNQTNGGESDPIYVNANAASLSLSQEISQCSAGSSYGKASISRNIPQLSPVHGENFWTTNSSGVNATTAETSQDSSPFTFEERQALLPPYQDPPDYDSYIRKKYGIHGSLPLLTQVDQHHSLPPPQTPAFTPVARNYFVSQSQQAIPQYDTNIYQNRSQLFRGNQNEQYSHYQNLNHPTLDVVTNSSPNLRINGSIGGTGLGHSNVGVSFDPHIRVKEIHDNHLLYPQTSSRIHQHPAAVSFFQSVPDLSEPVKANVVRGQSFAQKAYSRAGAPGPQMCLPVRVPRFPSGSEPNLPNMPIANGSVIGVDRKIVQAHKGMPSRLAPNTSHQLSSTSRHLSIDTLDLMKQNASSLSTFPDGTSRPTDLLSIPPSGGRRHSEQLSPTRVFIQQAKMNVIVSTERPTTFISKSVNAPRATQLEQQSPLTPPQPPLPVVQSSSPFQVQNMSPQNTSTSIDSPTTSTATTATRSNIREKPRPANLYIGTTARTDILDEEDSIDGIVVPSSFSDSRGIGGIESRLRNQELMREFDMIPRMNPTAKFATAALPENAKRNRFRDILPYEDNRVRINPSRDNRTGYINASHIVMSVGKMVQRYIAAQGPLKETVVDFWDMVWSNNVSVIVMVTELEEGGQQKCYPYFPESSDKKNSKSDRTIKFGDFVVSCNYSTASSSHVTTNLTLTLHGESRTIFHIKYTEWSDHTCPDVNGFLSFLEAVDAVHRQSYREGSTRSLTRRNKTSTPHPERSLIPPLLVHCSAGVGRSGVVILCDALIRALDFSTDINVPKTMTQLRFQRMLSVQNFGQYKFVYQVLAQYLQNSRLI